MSQDDGVSPSLSAAERAADPATPEAELRQLSLLRYDLHHLLAANPATPEDVVARLRSSSDRRVAAALAARPPSPASSARPSRRPSSPAEPVGPASNDAAATATRIRATLRSPTLRQSPSPPLNHRSPRRMVLGAMIVLAIVAAGVHLAGRDDGSLTLGALNAASTSPTATTGPSVPRSLLSTPSTGGAVPQGADESALSEAWAQGAARVWGENIGTDHDAIVVAGDYLLALKGTALSAYTPIAKDGLKEAWRIQLPEATGLPILSWGDDTAIYGSTLIDLATGSTRPAPWSSGTTVVVADDVAISCDAAGTCTAWSLEGTIRWNISIPESGLSSMQHPSARDGLSVVLRGGQRLIALGSTVVNLDDGATMALTPPRGGRSDDVEAIDTLPCRDGWFVVVRFASPDVPDQAAAYDFSGRQLWEGPLSLDDARELPHVVIPEGTFPTLQERWAQGVGAQEVFSGRAFATVEQQRVVTVTLPNGNTIFAPTHREDAFTTFAVTTTPRGRLIAFHGRTGQENSTCLTGLFDSQKGRFIAFYGVEPGEDGLIQVSPEFLVTYDPETGGLKAYAPLG